MHQGPVISPAPRELIFFLNMPYQSWVQCLRWGLVRSLCISWRSAFSCDRAELFNHFELMRSYHRVQVFLVRTQVHFTPFNFISSPLFQPSRPFSYWCFPLNLCHQQISSVTCTLSFVFFFFLLWLLIKISNDMAFHADLWRTRLHSSIVTCPCPISYLPLQSPPCPTSSPCPSHLLLLKSRQMQSPAFPLSKKSIILAKSGSINLCFTFAPLLHYSPFTSVTAMAPSFTHFFK